MTLHIAAFIFIPMMLLGALLIRPHALFMLPSLVVDLLIGIIIILPIIALQNLAVTQSMTRSLSRRSLVAGISMSDPCVAPSAG